MPKAPKLNVSGNKAIHPNSRKATVFQRDQKHKARIDGSRQVKSLRQDASLDKFLWFQQNMDEEKLVFSKKELTDLVLKYMDRFEEEIEQISIVNSIGCRANSKNQHASRLDSIKFTQDKEENEFSSTGLEVPNLMKKGNVELFKAWGGEMRYFSNIVKIKISKRDAEKFELEKSEKVME
ncbi:hypothetical protein LOTGIDRAFT_212070 [Lottia gigantea]|uniref:Translation machinery-associated protein 16 n=1 Tax=Lottia gigantea TaxID=225164 RepID=V4BDT4_LOTGI|nr:hypothetical protein LOTGIDRAFT_212070 [Lottia gigantea]ESP03902.1 hypothetical protein LOTGIDRAFT_212070 [Lottia gigantea]